MACPALGLEALQPLQPEPPPEPAFSEAQKWIEVGAGGWRAALHWRPEPRTRARSDRRSSLAFPQPPGFLLPAAPGHPLGLGEPRNPSALALESRARVGVKGDTAV